MEYQPPVPSIQQLAKSLLAALAIAAVLLITVVLPAEYGIDPLGTGKTLGLDKLASSEESEQEIIPGATTKDSNQKPVIAHAENIQTEERTIVLEPYDGIELKALMAEGEQFVFSWITDGAELYVDMHGEKANAGDEFTSYWKVKQQGQAKGTFTAPFSGTHGWYWQNNSDNAVTITVKLSGFFDKLYTP